MLILPAIEVRATPFCCELKPIKMKSEMNKIPAIIANPGQEPENELEFSSLPNNTNPHVKAVT
jgi:hypothetical protein